MFASLSQTLEHVLLDAFRITRQFFCHQQSYICFVWHSCGCRNLRKSSKICECRNIRKNWQQCKKNKVETKIWVQTPTKRIICKLHECYAACWPHVIRSLYFKKTVYSTVYSLVQSLTLAHKHMDWRLSMNVKIKYVVYLKHKYEIYMTWPLIADTFAISVVILG